MANTKAQVGDLIRIVKRNAKVTAYEVGGIYEVIRYSEEGTEDEQVVILGIDGIVGYVEFGEYVIHRKAGEEDSPKCTRDLFREAQLQIVEGKTPEEAVAISMAEVKAEQDAVNSPQHYTQGRVEVIDIIEDAVQGATPFEAVCQANIIKYILRYRHKNGITDINKAIWYANKLIAHEQRKIDGK